MRTALAWLLLTVAVTPAFAQFGGGGGGVSADDVAASIAASAATIMSAMPQASDVIPPTDTLNGAVGASTRFMREDAPRPTISQRTTVTTDVSGNWTVTWAKSFLSSTPVVIPMPVNPSASQPVMCNVTTRSASGATGKCWQNAVQAVALISLTISLTPVNLNAGSVMVLGIEPSQ